MRYCDDFIVGIIGDRADAERVKVDIGQFLADKLMLTLSPEKTLITHGQDKVRFLGYDITVCQDAATRRTSRGQSRVYSGKIKLYVPKDKWVGKLLEYGVLKMTTGCNAKERWTPQPRNDFMGLEPRETVNMYNAQLRGIYNYFRMANNASVLNKFHYIMEYSMYKTLAGKFRTTISKIKARYSHDGAFTVEYMTKSGTRSVTFYQGGYPRIVTPLPANVDYKPEYVVNYKPKELIFRMKAARCELCGKEHVPVSAHQVKRLKDLTGNHPWERVMLKMRRKTLIVCDVCHRTIHSVDSE